MDEDAEAFSCHDEKEKHIIMSYSAPWPRPYPGVTQLKPQAKKRITVEIPVTDFNAIVAVTLKSEILTTIAQYAIKHTATICRDNKLSLDDYDRFIEYICKRSFSEFTPSATTPDDRRRAEEVCRGVAAGADQSASAGQVVTRESKGQGRGGRGKGGAKSEKGKGDTGVGR